MRRTARSTCEAIEISVAVSAPGNGSQLPRIVVPSLCAVRRAAVVAGAARLVLRANGTRHGRVSVRAHDRSRRHVHDSAVRGALGSQTCALAADHDRRARRLAPQIVPTVVARARIDTSLDVNFRALTLPETVFVGQQANYEVAVFLNETVRDRLRRNPTFFPPDMQSMLAYDLPVARRSAAPPGRVALLRCARLSTRPLSAHAGAVRDSAGATRLLAAVVGELLRREETHELQTDSTVLVAVEPPAKGRPSDYGGAVGNLRVAAKLDTVGSRVGDPLTLTVRVSGTGNVKLFPRPAVGSRMGERS